MSDIFKHNKLTDFEKLLFALDYVKVLKSDIAQRDIEIGKLHSEIDELKFRIKKENPLNYKLHNHKVLIENLRSKLRKYKADYQKCFNELILLKNKAK